MRQHAKAHHKPLKEADTTRQNGRAKGRTLDVAFVLVLGEDLVFVGLESLLVPTKKNGMAASSRVSTFRRDEWTSRLNASELRRSTDRDHSGRMQQATRQAKAPELRPYAAGSIQNAAGAIAHAAVQTAQKRSISVQELLLQAQLLAQLVLQHVPAKTTEDDGAG